MDAQPLSLVLACPRRAAPLYSPLGHSCTAAFFWLPCAPPTGVPHDGALLGRSLGDSSVLNFLRRCKLFPKQLLHYTKPPSTPVSPDHGHHLFPTEACCEVGFQMVLRLICDVHHLSHGLTGHLCVFLEKCLLKSFAHLKELGCLHFYY